MANPLKAPPCTAHTTGVARHNNVTRRESADGYSRVLIQFFADWRLILCKHSKQWIIQSRSSRKPNKGVWVGRKHVTTKNALLVICSGLHLIRDAATAEKVLALPEKVSGGSQNG